MKRYLIAAASLCATAAFGWRVTWDGPNTVPDDAWPIDIIQRHIQAALTGETPR